MSPRVIGQWIGAAALGVVLGVVGTGIHRSAHPWGLLLALAAVLAAAVAVRAWIGGGGLLALGLGVATTVGVLGQSGPGADVLIVADVWGYVWYAGALMVVPAAFAPRRWFADAPATPSAPSSAGLSSAAGPSGPSEAGADAP